MTETWKAARACLLKGDDQGAVDYYVQLHNEDPDNEEASYMVFNTLCTNQFDANAGNEEKKTAFYAVSKTLVSAMEYIAKAEGSKDENLDVAARFIGMYLPLADFATKNAFTTPSERIQLAGISMYEAGNAVEKAYNSDHAAMMVAAVLWKEGVKIQQKFYAYKYSGNKAEDYAQKIKKVEPAYEMPKKAGCISLG